MYNQYLFIFVITFLVIEKFFIAKILFLIYLFILMEDEFVAWLYCFKHKSEWQK
jgi:hypothetical protein